MAPVVPGGLTGRLLPAMRRLRVSQFPSAQPPKPRLFNHNSQLLLLSRPVNRPQLPFLHPTSRVALQSNNVTLQARFNRLMSNEAKKRWKQRLRWQLRFHLYFWPTCAICFALYVGVHQTKLERDYPTPRDWSFLSRWFLRSAQYELEIEYNKGRRVLVDWRRVAYFLNELLQRLEDKTGDGMFILENGGDGGILVEGVGHTGYDISMKSEPWRRGYWQALMNAARAAENLDGFVLDITSRKIYPADVVVGPSNPRPKPMPFGNNLIPPQEGDCEPAFESPQVYYMKILTTEGFSTKQRMDAALAYAEWLDFKGLGDTAGSMYDWTIDIAASGLPVDVNFVSSVLDLKTGVINPTATEFVSDNLLNASTAMAVHYASIGDVKKALPIFLSVLRARRDLPAEQVTREMMEKKSKIDQVDGLWAYLYGVLDWLAAAPYPPRPSDGNERPVHNLKEACEEVGLMTYIGEILYATSSQEKGLSWTRDAVDAAEAVMWVMREEDREDGREKCQECLKTGLDNWKKMARSMAVRAERQEHEAAQNPSWFASGQEKWAEEARRWEEEEQQIELRMQKTDPLISPVKTPSTWLGASV